MERRKRVLLSDTEQHTARVIPNVESDGVVWEDSEE